MRITYKTPDGRLVFELEAASIKDAFMKVGMIQEAFEADTECGCCTSRAVKLELRYAQDYTFYEMRCTACKARLDFGQAKKGGGLFVKRDERPDTRGWYVYEGQDGGGGREEYDQRRREPDAFDQRQPPPMQSAPRQQQQRAAIPPPRGNAPIAAGITDDDVPF